ncbi:MAG: LysR family transcriptional regulator [Rhodobacteraceae bacterium]|nr:LysR family transcriptional regulator [Paracoccaceae bacterium]
MNLSDAVTLKQMRALSAVARHGSITAAAEALRLSPPAIHSQLKGLEAIVETPVLQRTSDTAGSQLTEAGRALLEAAERIEVILSQCGGQVDALSRGQAGKVVLGVVSTGKYFAPKLVKRLKTLCPEIDIVLRVGNRDDVIRDLERHAADLTVMGRPPRWPPLETEPLGPHPHGLVAAPDHPLAGKHGVTAADLASQTFLAREDGSGTRILMTRYLDRIGDGQVFETVEMGSNETIKQAVIAGLGIALLSLHTVMDELHAGRLVLIDAPGLPIVRHWFLVWPADKPMRPVTDRVRGAILELNGGFLPE